MKLYRQGFIAVLLLTAVGYAFFAPLLPMHVVARHHLGAVCAIPVSFAGVSFNATPSFFSSTVPEQPALHPQGLIELHCTRLC
jgi:hypothetical protein